MKPLWKKVVTLKTKNRTTMLLLFIYLVMSNSLDTLDYSTRVPCSSLSPRVCSNSCSLSRWCHQTISSSVIPFSSCLQSLPASRSFQISQFFKSSGQIIEASASVLPMNIQSWLTGLISKLFKALSRVFSNITVQKHQLCGALPSLQLNSHIHTWILENHSLHSTEVGW